MRIGASGVVAVAGIRKPEKVLLAIATRDTRAKYTQPCPGIVTRCNSFEAAYSSQEAGVAPGPHY